MTPGSTRGFRIIPCIAAPERPRLAPIRVPSSARGKRSSMRTRDSSDPLPAIVSAIAWPTGSEARPNAMEAAIRARTASDSNAISKRSSSRGPAGLMGGLR